MKSILTLLGDYFGAVVLCNFTLAGLSIAFRRRSIGCYFWLPAVLLNGLIGIYSVSVALPGFAARGPDAIGMVFLFIPLGLGLVFIILAITAACLRPSFSLFRLVVSVVPFVLIGLSVPYVETALGRTAIIQILDSDGKPCFVTADLFFPNKGEIAVENGDVIVRFPYHESYVPIVVHRADGMIADIGLSYVGISAGKDGYRLSESEIGGGTTVDESSLMRFKIKPIKWKKPRSPTRRYSE